MPFPRYRQRRDDATRASWRTSMVLLSSQGTVSRERSEKTRFSLRHREAGDGLVFESHPGSRSTRKEPLPDRDGKEIQEKECWPVIAEGSLSTQRAHDVYRIRPGDGPFVDTGGEAATPVARISSSSSPSSSRPAERTSFLESPGTVR